MSEEYTPSRDEMAFGFAKVLVQHELSGTWSSEYFAKRGYELADAMVAYRKKLLARDSSLLD